MSVQRHCRFWLATDGQWYLLLGDFEHAWEDHDCTAYGPFLSQEEADDYQYRRFPNPGGAEIDDSGTEPLRMNSCPLSDWPLGGDGE